MEDKDKVQVVMRSSYDDLTNLYKSTNAAYRFLINELIGQMSAAVDQDTDRIDMEVVKTIIRKSLVIAGGQ